MFFLGSYLRDTFRFRKTNVTVLFILAYCFIAFCYIVDQVRYKYALPFVDAKKLPIVEHLDSAWDDLQNITYSYHPYTARDNDRVHDYILERVLSITDSVQFAKVEDDMANNSSSIFKQQDVFNSNSTKNRIIYFESSNILVKLQGSNPKLPSLLLSAHFDSVPTSHGATDDGKGIVSLLALLEYYSKNQPERSIIFNFNNNEEFGLLGATHFTFHEWFNSLEYFINLEGTGTGTKSVLFRTSDISTAEYYREAVKIEPFGNSIFQQGFNQRVIASETDYKIYESNGLRGWDIAFYRPRDLYHTTFDDIKHTSKEALWHMLSTSWQLTDYMVGIDFEERKDTASAVYFDFIGLVFLTCKTETFLIVDCILLLIVPLILFFFYYSTRRKHTLSSSSWIQWLRFPISMLITLPIMKLTEIFLREVNPYLIFRDFYTPVAFFLLEFLILMSSFNYLFDYFWSFNNYKDISLIYLTIIAWLLLAYNTYHLISSNYILTGCYIATFTFSSVSFALFLKFIFSLFTRNKSVDASERVKSGANSRYGSTNEANSNIDDSVATDGDEQHQIISNRLDGSSNEEDERQPLVISRSASTNSAAENNNSTKTVNFADDTEYEWVLQFLVLVPLLIVLYQSFFESLSAMAQTMIESEKAYHFVWTTLFISVILISILHTPFLRMRFEINALFVILFILLLFRCLLIIPFTSDTPLKIRFRQNLNGDVELGGIGNNLDYLKDVITNLPSFKQNGNWYNCDSHTQKCSYHGILPQLVDSNSTNLNMMQVDVVRNDKDDDSRSKYAPIDTEIKIKVVNNRACNLYLNNSIDGSSNVRTISIYGNNSDDIKKSIRINGGIQEVQLHKLNFDHNEYHFNLQWFPKIFSSTREDEEDEEDKLSLSVVCYWGEYDSETIVNGKRSRQVPALDELMLYSPASYSFTNLEKGLVYASQELEL